MQDFDELISVIEKLLGPDGCVWDREQTMVSMRGSLLEETCEAIEAIDLDHPLLMEEELGDLFFNIVFMCKLAEKEGRFTMKHVLQHIITKLIRRHPHVFGDAKVDTADGVIKQWEEIKKKEKGAPTAPGLLEGIPKTLPVLAQAQKVAKRMEKAGLPIPSVEGDPFQNEESLGTALFDMAATAQKKGLDAEQALRSLLARLGVEKQDEQDRKRQDKNR